MRTMNEDFCCDGGAPVSTSKRDASSGILVVRSKRQGDRMTH